MIEGTDLHVLILVFVTLSLIQDNGDARREGLLCQLSPKVVSEFGWNLASRCRIVGLISLLLILSHLINTRGRDSNLVDFKCQFLSHWYDSTLKKSWRQRDSNPGSSALVADAFTTRPTRRSVSMKV